uniref:RNA-binding S4 domain-containing protein n=1 Tax=Auxenochlorella protothecoides TaxID=3075 RepID=A0A1D1ZTC6_AUXPR
MRAFTLSRVPSNASLLRALWQPRPRRRCPQHADAGPFTTSAMDSAAHATDETPVTNKGAYKKSKRRRLDEVCVELHPMYSKNVIQSWIAQGLVTVNGQPVLKAGTGVDPASSRIDLLADPPRYVCRAGLKLEAALDHFSLDPKGWTTLDAGLSTGGFTDCLLQRGARRVVGVDVGYGQVAERVRQHPAVTVMERTNVRHLRRAALPGGEPVDLVTLDLSFISVIKVLDMVMDVLKPGGHLIVLIKPQFEAGKAQVSAGGLVRDPAVHADVIRRVQEACMARGLVPQGHMPSPIKGANAGNTEFLAHFVFQATGAGVEEELEDGEPDEPAKS